MPLGSVPIMTPPNPASSASPSTSAAMFPSCKGTVASGVKRVSPASASRMQALMKRLQARPSPTASS